MITAIKNVLKAPARWKTENETTKRFDLLRSQGKIKLERDKIDQEVFVVERCFATAEEAIEASDRFDNFSNFSEAIARGFTEGIKDGITTYRRELAKLGPMYGKALAIGDEILEFISKRSP